MIRSKFIKSQDTLMTSCRQKVPKRGKICRFLTRLIENSALQYLRAMKILPAETGNTRLPLQLQQSLLHYVR